MILNLIFTAFNLFVSTTIPIINIIVSVIDLAITAWALYHVTNTKDYTGQPVQVFTYSYFVLGMLSQFIYCFFVDQSRVDPKFRNTLGQRIFAVFIWLLISLYYFYWMLVATRIIEKADHEFTSEDSYGPPGYQGNPQGGQYLEETLN